MQVALLTVGDEILAGDIENTNATWLARQLTERGVTVTRILTVPDDRGLIAETLRDWTAQFDAVVVTGGLGGTPDDVTMDAVADAVGVEMAVNDEAKTDVEATIAAYREQYPDLAERYPDLDLDVTQHASIPAGARPLLNTVGLSPGCVIGGVYVFPGIPEEMKAMFDAVAEEFGGSVVSETLYTDAPEGALTEQLRTARDEFGVAVGSYPSRGEPNRLKIVGEDAEAVAAATAWLREHVETVDR
ncbi:competence/damage-inducible protein A [Salinirubrum litoreum]|uniref:Competence/damage-inducible protein A n=1 Tax=Salinirubrum litoreum TaxID=1126234 RepID=A0ABD5R6X1_9EURY|nr:competence/damage-inducible protein A [Salinirubrum litoreum]